MYRSLNSENAKEIMEKVAYLKACEENLKEYSLDGLSEAYDDFCKYGDKDIINLLKLIMILYILKMKIKLII